MTGVLHIPQNINVVAAITSLVVTSDPGAPIRAAQLETSSFLTFCACLAKGIPRINSPPSIDVLLPCHGRVWGASGRGYID